MNQRRLRIYRGPEQSDMLTATHPKGGAKSCITVPLGEVLSLLADAVAEGRPWVEDFEDDEITISSDLYEVLMAYQCFRPVA